MKSWMTKTLMLAVIVGTAVATYQPAVAEKQPHMGQALAHLEKAQQALKNAQADKGGHRVKALELVTQAIKEVKEGVAHDNHH